MPLSSEALLRVITLSSTLILTESSIDCTSSPLGPLTVTLKLSMVTVTPSGILIGDFPIRDIFSLELSVNST